MNISEIKQEIPEAEVKKDYFGAEFFYIPPQVLSKRKAWNLLLKRGFEVMPNKDYLKKDRLYIHNNHLMNYLLIEVEQ